MGFMDLLRRGASLARRRSTAILTYSSAAGVLVTVIFAVEATTKADKIRQEMDEEYLDRCIEDDIDTKSEHVSNKEIFKRIAPLYIPTFIMGGLTIFGIIWSHRIDARKNAVIAGLYSASELALKEFQSKTIEEIGEKKVEQIRDKIAKDHLDKNPMSNNEIIITGLGDVPCYDTWSGRYFKSNIEKIRATENVINHEILAGSEMWASLNQLYYELGLPPVKSGEEMGFDVDHMLHFQFSSHIADNGQPCFVIDYTVVPRDYKYR